MERKRGIIPSTRARKRGKRGKELGSSSFVDLPFPITTDILVRLPIKLILICKLVCRTWNTLISDPHFAKLHFDRSRFGFMIRVRDKKLISRTLYLLEDEPSKLTSNRICNNILKLEPTFKLPLRDAKLVLDKQDGSDGLLVSSTDDHRFDVVNSCNGLLCLSEPFNSDPLVVCNPVTGAFIRLPNVTKGSKRTWYSGIGFQTKTNEYKVVRIVCGFLNVEINVVGTPTWNNVRVDGNFSSISRLKSPTFVNEALHWICYRVGYSILRFNFEIEKLQFIRLPLICTYDPEHYTMGVLKDSLSVCNTSFCPSTMDLWIMKNDDNRVLWTKVITLTREIHRDIRLYWPSTTFDNENCFLGYCSKKGFIYYRDTKNRPKRFLVSGTQEKLLDVVLHIPSLISLKDVVKRDDVEVLNVHSQNNNPDIMGRIAVLLWCIWTNRNNKVWNSNKLNAKQVGLQAKHMWTEWSTVNELTNTQANNDQHRTAASDVQWQQPPEGAVKCNVDASFYAEAPTTGWGWCVRDHNGSFILAGTDLLQTQLTTLEGEAMALLEAMKHMVQRGYSKVIFESDSRLVVDAITTANNGISDFSILISCIKSLLLMHPNFEVKFVRRQANMAAHLLARAAYSLASCRVYDFIPPCIATTLFNEMN